MERLVVKIGTNAIVKNGNGLDIPFMDDIARQVACVRENYDTQIVIVSSGAIASGWRRSFKKQGIMVGEALLKDEDVDNFGGGPLLKASGFGVVIINGPDAAYDPTIEKQIISIDNDRLARAIAYVDGANKLVMLTEAEGVLDRNKNVIPEIANIADLERVVYFEKTNNGTGGLSSKLLEARRFITDANKLAYIAGARTKDVVVKIARGERVGTRITLPLQGFLLSFKEAPLGSKIK